MTTMADFDELVSPAWTHISSETRVDGSYRSTTGAIVLASHDTIACFYIYEYQRGNGWTGIEVVWDGLLYRRIWERAWSKRTLYRLARAMLDDLGVPRCA